MIKKLSVNNPLKYIFCLFFLFYTLTCTKKQIDDNDILATVGDEKITVKDFKIAYELFPEFNSGKIKNVQQRKKIQLNALIEKKLLIKYAEQNGIEKKQRVRDLINWYEPQAVIKQLYQSEIKDQVSVSSDEKEIGFKRLKTRLFLRQLYFKSAVNARKVYAEILNGKYFEDIAFSRAKSEKELIHILTPKEFSWGDLDKRLEDVAYKLGANEISEPIKTESGYHILQLTNKKESVLLTEYDYQNRENYVKTIIRRRREAKLAKAYANRLMEKLRPQANGKTLQQFVNAGKKAFVEIDKKNIPDYLQPAMIRPYLTDLINEVIIEFNGGEWTVNDLITRIEKLHPKARFDMLNMARLPYHLSKMVLDDALSKEGYKKDLDQHPNVRREVNRNRQNILALYMRNSLVDTTEMDVEEVEIYFQEHNENYGKPEMVRIKEVMVRNKELADSLHQEVESGTDISTVANEHSVRKWAADKGGDLGYFARGAFGAIGENAFEMNTGDLSEVIPVEFSSVIAGYSFFSVIDKKTAEYPDLLSIREEVEKDALLEKKKNILNKFFSDQKKKVHVYYDNELLKMIRTIDELHPGSSMQFVLKDQY